MEEESLVTTLMPLPPWNTEPRTSLGGDVVIQVVVLYIIVLYSVFRGR